MNTKDKVKKKMFQFKNKILDLIYPNNIKCGFCNEELNERAHNNTCCSCLNSLPFITNPCEKCGTELGTSKKGICFRCFKTNRSFDIARSVFSYEGEAKNIVQKIKYFGKVQHIEMIVNYLIEAYQKYSMKADCVTFVPMFKKKLKLRGYNQAKLLAEEFCKQTKLPLYDFCEKIMDNTSQTELDFKARLENVKDTFKFKTELKSEIKDKRVLVIDDIFTTGATTNEVCKVLLEKGAKECFVFTLAHTMLEEHHKSSFS